MSTNGRRVPDDPQGSGRRAGGEHGGTDADRRRHGDRATLHTQTASDSASPMGFSRKRRRRQRTQRGKRHHPGSSRPTPNDTVSRERIFQDIEGLLRRIREQAEESTNWTEQQLSEITQTVTSFTRSLEAEADPISDRARSEYQRIRDKLNQAMKG